MRESALIHRGKSVDALGPETGRAHRVKDAVDVLRAVGFNGDAQGNRISVMAGSLELVVIECDDVSALFGQDRGHLDQLATSKFMMRPRAIMPF